MKRIAFLVLHLGYGGAERAVISEANLLSEFCQVEILCLYKLYDKPAFDVDPKVKITYLSETLRPNREEFKAALRQKNLFRVFSEGFKAVKTLYLRKALMRKAVRESDADIIVSSGYLYHELLTKNAKKGTVCIAQEHNHHDGNAEYIEKIVRSVRDMDYFMPVSRELTEFYSTKVAPGVCCKYIPHHLEYFPDRVSPLTGKNLISVGRLSPEKGMDDLIRVFHLVHERFPDWHLHVVGDGDQRSSLEDLIRSLDLERFVTLHGFRSQREIRELNQDCSLYVMASHKESFGLVLIEAQASGLPCVAFDSARGACEILEDGETGILIPDRSLQGMADGIGQLISDPGALSRMGAAGRENAKVYTYENVKEEWAAFIASL